MRDAKARGATEKHGFEFRPASQTTSTSKVSVLISLFAGPRNRRNQKPWLFGREIIQRHRAAAATPVDGWRFVPPRITFWLREAGVPIAKTLRQHNISKPPWPGIGG
jgi:hypothetical protein